MAKPMNSRYLVWFVGISLATCLSSAVLAEEEPEPATSAPESEASEETVPPQIILATQKAPEYPPAALAARFTGTVKVAAQVLPDGSVGKVDVVECTHKNVGFEEAAIEAVKQWRFEPAIENGVATDYVMHFRLNFKSAGPGTGFVPFVSSGLSGPETGGRGKHSTQTRSTSSGSTTRSSGDKGSDSDRDRGD